MRVSNDQLDPGERWELRLYVAGQSPKSIAAYTNLTQFCETYLAGRYRIQVVDLLVNVLQAFQVRSAEIRAALICA